MNAKLLAWLFAAMVIVSMSPAALAESGRDGDNDSDDSVEVESETEIEVEDSDSEVRTRYRVRDGREEIRMEFRERIRDVRGDVIELRTRVREHREDYRELRAEYEERRDQIIDVKARVAQECRSGRASDSCLRLRAEFNVGAQEFLLAAAGKVTDHLLRIEQYVEEHVEDEERKAELLSDIAQVQAEVDAAIVTIEALPENATREDLVEAREQVRTAWQHATQLTRELRGKLVVAKVHSGLQKMENLEERLYNVRDELEGAGADVSDLNGLLGQFSAHLEAAASADTPQEARAEFSAAVHLVREIMHEIRDLRAELRGEAESDADSADDSDEDNSDGTEDESDDSDEADADDSEDESEGSETDDSDDAQNESDDDSGDGLDVEINTTATVTV